MVVEKARRPKPVTGGGEHVRSEQADRAPIHCSIRRRWQGLFDAVAMFRAGFPDIQIWADRLVAEAESVAVHGRIKGTNTGPLMGSPATGKRADFGYMDMYRIANGQVVEVWRQVKSPRQPRIPSRS
jgi:predicted ester cyclase